MNYTNNIAAHRTLLQITLQIKNAFFLQQSSYWFLIILTNLSIAQMTPKRTTVGHKLYTELEMKR
jgi:hypothetical protein